MMAVRRDNINLVEFFIENNADLDMYDPEGNTALIVAAQNHKDDIFELLLKNRYQGELICGIRVKRHDSVSKKIQSKLANKIRNLVTHDGISDTNCPLKIGRTNLLNRLPLFSGMHRFLPALVKMTGNRVYTVPVRHQERKHGVSKFNLANRAFSGLEDLFAFAWMRSRYIEPSVAESDLKDR